jgi:hypothetical protein
MQNIFQLMHNMSRIEHAECGQQIFLGHAQHA